MSGMDQQTEDRIRSIENTLVRMEHILENIAQMQTEARQNMVEVRDAVYHPDNGLYARVKDLEQWQNGAKKIIWSGGLSILALVTKTFYDLL